jgi:hypothetical protein
VKALDKEIFMYVVYTEGKGYLIEFDTYCKPHFTEDINKAMHLSIEIVARQCAKDLASIGIKNAIVKDLTNDTEYAILGTS